MTEPGRVNVQTFLNEHPFSTFQWVVFALCFLIMLLDGFDTAAIGFIAPSLMKEWGVARHDLAPVLIAALFPLGSVGAVLFGWLVDRYNANRIIAVGYALTAAAIYAIGQAAGSVGLLVLLVFVGGALMNTAQSSMPALAAGYYPTQGRATGAAWMLGIGCYGGIAGSFLVAELARRHLGFEAIFSIVAVPGLIAAAALLVEQIAPPETPAEHAVAMLEAHGH